MPLVVSLKEFQPPARLRPIRPTDTKETHTNALRDRQTQPQPGTWCSGITPVQHAGGPGFNPQCVQVSVHVMLIVTAPELVDLILGQNSRKWHKPMSYSGSGLHDTRNLITAVPKSSEPPGLELTSFRVSCLTVLQVAYADPMALSPRHGCMGLCQGCVQPVVVQVRVGLVWGLVWGLCEACVRLVWCLCGACVGLVFGLCK